MKSTLENKNTKASKATTTKKTTAKEADGNVKVCLLGDKARLSRHAKAAGTTDTNLARVLIRYGLSKLDSGEFKITCPPCPSVIAERDERSAERGGMSATFPVRIPYTAQRLAYQLGVTPEEIMKKALRIGLRNIDWNLANDCDTFADGCDSLSDELNITLAMNSLSAEEFSELCDGHEEPQKVLVNDHNQRRFAEFDERKKAEKLARFFGPPRDVD